MKGLISNKLFLSGAIIILILIIFAVLAPFLAKYNPTDINLKDALLAPSSGHFFGTDSLGRDLYSRIIYGARISLSVGFIAVAISALIGIFIGAIAGYYGGWLDNCLSRFIDIMLCFPSFFLILAVVALLEPNIINVMVIIGLTNWMGLARLVRGQVLSIKEMEFVQAGKAAGTTNFNIIIRHIIPNTMGPIVVSLILAVAGAILIESAISFLGLGVQPPIPSWGNMLIDAKQSLGVCWWTIMFPGLAILITVLGFNMLGEGLREHFNPRIARPVK